MGFLRQLARLFVREDGSIAVMSAITGACVIGCAGLAIDVGQLYLDRRHLQNMADLAALAAVENLASRDAIVRSVLDANGVAFSGMQVEAGHFDRTAPLGERYSTGGASPNAVKVTLEAPGKLYFIRAIYRGDPPLIRVAATATEENVAQFSIGSRLASLDEGLVNQLLGQLLGTSVSLTLMDYRGLALADLDLLQFLDALASEIDVDAGTYDSLLDADIAVADILAAAAAVADRNGEDAARVALNKLLGLPGLGSIEVDGGRLLDLGPLGDLGIGETPAGLKTRINAFDLLRTVAEASGQHQVALNLNTDVPGLLGVSAYVAIGEPPQNTSWITVGQEGAKVYTAQTRVRLDVNVAPLLGSVVSLPILIDIAAGEAELTGISCGANPAVDASVRLTARPSLAKLWIGQPSSMTDWNAFQTPSIAKATILNAAGLVQVKASAHAAATNQRASVLDFSAAEIAARTVKTVATQDTVSTLLASLLGNIELELGILNPLSPLLGGLLNTVSALLAPVAGLLDPILYNLLDLLGVHIGEADLRVLGVRCGVPALVL